MGSLRRKPSGRWEARYRDPTGRLRGQTFRTKRDAELFLQRVGADIQRGDFVDPGAARIRFGEWAARWIATKLNVKPSTYADYESLLNTHLLPHFGQHPIAAIDRGAVQAWVVSLERNGLGTGTVRNAYGLLRQIMASAVDADAIRKSPCVRIDLPRIRRDEMRFASYDEVARLAHAMEHPRDRRGRSMGTFPCFGLAVQVAAYTGLRFGELAALRKKRVDLERKTIHVAEAAKEVRGVVVYGPTKTYQDRAVPIPDFLVGRLADHLARLRPDPDTLVFTAEHGGPLRNSNFRRRFERAVAQANLPPGFRIHDLRHSFTAFLIAEGGHPQAIKQRLGHSSIQVTFDRYGHLFPALESRLTDALDAAARNAASASEPRA